MSGNGIRKFTLGKEERLKSRKLIERVFREGKSFALFPFRVYYAPLATLLPGAGKKDGSGEKKIGAGGKAGEKPGSGERIRAGGKVGKKIVVRGKVGEKIVVRGKVGGKPGVKVFLQAGFGAGTRNFKKAVDRNRIKRLTKEAYRLQKHVLQDHLTKKGRALAVFFIYVGKELPDQGLVSSKIGLALEKLITETGS